MCSLVNYKTLTSFKVLTFQIQIQLEFRKYRKFSKFRKFKTIQVKLSRYFILRQTMYYSDIFLISFRILPFLIFHQQFWFNCKWEKKILLMFHLMKICFFHVHILSFRNLFLYFLVKTPPSPPGSFLFIFKPPPSSLPSSSLTPSQSNGFIPFSSIVRFPLKVHFTFYPGVRIFLVYIQSTDKDLQSRVYSLQTRIYRVESTV